VDTVKIDDDLLIPAGRHTLPPEEVSQRQRERLVRAIVLCASDRGYERTTIGDVVRVARVSRSAFYENFTDKEACFLEAYRQMTAAFIGASLKEASRVESWDEKLDVGILTYFRFMGSHPEVAHSTVVEIHSAGRAGAKARATALRQWMRTIEGVAILAAREGVEVRQLGEAAYAAIVLTAEAYVQEYAHRRQLDRVVEKASDVQALARALFTPASVSGDGVVAAATA
jgi:AcrR family transcriptional regulator